MHNHKEVRKLSLFGALLFFCGTSVATAAKATETVQSLAAVQSQIPVLQATLEVAKLEKEISNVRSGKSASGSKPANPYGSPPMAQTTMLYPPSATPLQGATPSQGATPTTAPSLPPRVLSISGAHGSYRATLALPDGGVLSVSDGNHVGDWVIRHVGPHGVLASHKDKAPVLLLMSGGYAPAQQGGGSSASARSPLQSSVSPMIMPPPPMPSPGMPSNMRGGA